MASFVQPPFNALSVILMYVLQTNLKFEAFGTYKQSQKGYKDMQQEYFELCSHVKGYLNCFWLLHTWWGESRGCVRASERSSVSLIKHTVSTVHMGQTSVIS